MGMGIGQKTFQKFLKIISESKTIFWNGLKGVFEMNNIRKETIRVACGLASTGAITIAEGGYFVSFINKIDIASQIT